MTMNGGNGSSHDDDDNPKKAGGYKSPPVHGRIKPGEVRNPHGRNGRSAQEDDAFEKVRRRKGRVSFDGTTSNLMSDEAYWLKVMSMALAGNMAAARIVWKELAARRETGPARPTAQEQMQQEAEYAERERMSMRLVQLLEEKAEAKRNEGPHRVRYGLDGRPILPKPADVALKEGPGKSNE